MTALTVEGDQDTANQPTGSRSSWITIWLPIIAICGLSALEALRWVLLYRVGQPLDIDEAGYISIAMVDLQGMQDGGLPGLLEAINAQPVNAPGAPALAALLLALVGRRPDAALLLPITMSIITLLATYLIGRRVASRFVGLFAALGVAITPVFVDYQTSFNFAMPATCALTLAVLCYYRSSVCSRFGFTIAFGVVVGLVPLFRTMALIYLPGLALAVAIQIVVSTKERLRRAVLALGSGVIAVAVAATWYWTNWRSVYEYLTSFGYGNRSVEYGTSSSLLSADAWLSLAQYVLANLYLPVTVLVGVGAIGIVLKVIRFKRTHSLARTALVSARSPLLAPLVISGSGLLILASSPNHGSGFLLPAVPLIFTITAVGIRALFQTRRWTGLAAIGLVAVTAYVPKIDLTSPVATPTSVVLPAIGSTALSDGRGTIQTYEAGGGFDSGFPALPIPQPEGRAWRSVISAGARRLAGMGGSRNVSAFGFRHRLYNTNSLQLARLSSGALVMPLVGVSPVATGNTEMGYHGWLMTGDAARACILLTSTGAFAEFQPVVDSAALVRAARSVGFVPVGTEALPDGRTIDYWKRADRCSRRAAP